MKTLFEAKNRVIAVSVIALLSFVGYAFLESLFFLGEWVKGIAAAGLMTIVVIAITGGWIWSLLAAKEGRRAGFVAALVFSLFPALFTLYDLVYFSPIPYGWPLLQAAVWITFASNILAIVAITMHLRKMID